MLPYTSCSQNLHAPILFRLPYSSRSHNLHAPTRFTLPQCSRSPNLPARIIFTLPESSRFHNVLAPTVFMLPQCMLLQCSCCHNVHAPSRLVVRSWRTISSALVTMSTQCIRLGPLKVTAHYRLTRSSGVVLVLYCSQPSTPGSPAPLLVTAAVDAIEAQHPLQMSADMTMRGQVVWTGRTALDLRMELIQVGGRGVGRGRGGGGEGGGWGPGGGGMGFRRC